MSDDQKPPKGTRLGGGITSYPGSAPSVDDMLELLRDLSDLLVLARDLAMQPCGGFSPSTCKAKGVAEPWCLSCRARQLLGQS